MNILNKKQTCSWFIYYIKIMSVNSETSINRFSIIDYKWNDNGKLVRYICQYRADI